MPDLKTLDNKVSAKFFNAPDYPDAAKAAILKMIDIIKNREYKTKSKERVKSKVIIRHLILPGYLESTYSVLRWFAENIKENALLSLMTQYTPIPTSKKIAPERFVNKADYEAVMGWLEEFGIEDGFFQELLTGDEWLPDFKRINPFPSKISVPVWSCIN
jgi:putative pyruvate formate lyase activating enzyme